MNYELDEDVWIGGSRWTELIIVTGLCAVMMALFVATLMGVTYILSFFQ